MALEHGTRFGAYEIAESIGAGGSTLMVVPVETEPEFSPGTAVSVYSGNYDVRDFGISPDGQRFLLQRTPVQEGVTGRRFIIVQNWFEELRRLAPRGE